MGAAGGHLGPVHSSQHARRDNRSPGRQMLLCPQSVMKLPSDSGCAPDEARFFAATGGVNILPGLHRLGDAQGARTLNRICENDANDRVDRAAAFSQARELRWGIRGYL